ncbi:peptide ABC transporter ATP-binding protein [Lachnotalea glycerini]|nr:peptide ABC transporter ATP-binding protein [Lachnotalea glycerini]
MQSNEHIPLLRVQDLEISFFTYVGEVKAVRKISYDLYPGEVMGIVGESGSGKSVSSYGVMGILPNPGKIVGGRILFDGRDITHLPEKELLKIRGKDISMIFQDPMTSLNPVFTVGNQINEVLIKHTSLTNKERLDRIIELFELVGITQPEKRIQQYPHEFSGGMRQRVMIAMALACNPKLLIADEPTTALDVTIQAQIIALLKELKDKIDMSVIFITHDLGVVAQTCEKVAVMYAGEVIEYGRAEHIFSGKYLHPYTQGLFNAIPKLDEDVKRLETIDGMIPDPTERMEGCRFASRCKYAKERCKKAPDMIEIEEQHYIKCHLFAESKDKNAGRDEKDGR